MNNKTDIDIKYVSPLKKILMTIGELPTSYIETMSYYEMLVWFTEFLRNQVIPTVNNNAEAVQELQTLYEELRTYVNNYFDSQDWQAMVNNKLEDMLESGQLQEIISQFLQSTAIWCFDSVSDLKEATNLIDGSYAKTLGYYEPNDGGSALYKITETASLTNYQETLDSGLYATIIINDESNPEMFGAKGDGTTDDTAAFQNALNTSKKVKALKSYLLTDIVVNNGNEIEFSPNSIIYRNKTDAENNAGLFVANGSLNSSEYTLTDEVTEDSNIIALNSVTGLSKGDIIYLKNPAVEGADSNKQLISTIVNISGTQVTLANPLQWTYPVDSVVQKLNPIHFKINGNGCEFNNNGLVGRGYFVTVNYANNFIIENINVNNCATGVCRIHYSINGIIKNCEGKNPPSLSAPYGEFLQICYSTNINSYNITGNKYRRLVDYVGATYCNTYDSHGFDSGFTTHGLLAKRCSFINCNYEQLKGSIDRPCIIGNLSYYYDKDITFDNCSFVNGNRNIYIVNNDCTCIIKNCYFYNAEMCIYNEGLKVIIENTLFDNIKGLIGNGNSTTDNEVKLINCNVMSRGTSPTNLITSDHLKTINYIYNCSFKGTNKLGNGLYILNNTSIDMDTNTSIGLLTGSRVYNSYISRNFSGTNDNKIFNTVFNAYTHGDATNAQNVVIEGCLNSGSINVIHNTEAGNYIQNNTSIQIPR